MGPSCGPGVLQRTGRSRFRSGTILFSSGQLKNLSEEISFVASSHFTSMGANLWTYLQGWWVSSLQMALHNKLIPLRVTGNWILPWEGSIWDPWTFDVWMFLNSLTWKRLKQPCIPSLSERLTSRTQILICSRWLHSGRLIELSVFN